MALERVIIKNEKATFVCPACGRTRVEPAERFKHVKKSILIKRRCLCGHVHKVLLERRQFFRKEVNIPGTFSRKGTAGQHPMVVKDLSRSGVKIEVPQELEVGVGERLVLDFRLDNKQRTAIRKDVMVRSIHGLILGTEFCSRDPNNPIDKAYDMAIGFYTYN